MGFKKMKPRTLPFIVFETANIILSMIFKIVVINIVIFYYDRARANFREIIPEIIDVEFAV